MKEYTTIVSIRLEVLGDPNDYSGSFPITVDQNTSLEDVTRKMEQGIESIKEVYNSFGAGILWHLMHHISRLRIEEEAETEEETGE